MAKVHHIKTENKRTEQHPIIQIILMLLRFVPNIIWLCLCRKSHYLILPFPQTVQDGVNLGTAVRVGHGSVQHSN